MKEEPMTPSNFLGSFDDTPITPSSYDHGTCAYNDEDAWMQLAGNLISANKISDLAFFNSESNNKTFNELCAIFNPKEVIFEDRSIQDALFVPTIGPYMYFALGTLDDVPTVLIIDYEYACLVQKARENNDK